MFHVDSYQLKILTSRGGEGCSDKTREIMIIINIISIFYFRLPVIIIRLVSTYNCFKIIFKWVKSKIENYFVPWLGWEYEILPSYWRADSEVRCKNPAQYDWPLMKTSINWDEDDKSVKVLLCCSLRKTQNIFCPQPEYSIIVSALSS